MLVCSKICNKIKRIQNNNKSEKWCSIFCLIKSTIYTSSYGYQSHFTSSCLSAFFVWIILTSTAKFCTILFIFKWRFWIYTFFCQFIVPASFFDSNFFDQGNRFQIHQDLSHSSPLLAGLQVLLFSPSKLF